MRFPKEGELWRLFHNLWTRDVGTTGYDKGKWRRMEQLIFDGYPSAYVDFKDREILKAIDILQKAAGNENREGRQTSDSKGQDKAESVNGSSSGLGDVAVSRPVSCPSLGSSIDRDSIPSDLPRFVYRMGQVQRDGDPVCTGSAGGDSPGKEDVATWQDNLIRAIDHLSATIEISLSPFNPRNNDTIIRRT